MNLTIQVSVKRKSKFKRLILDILSNVNRAAVSLSLLCECAGWEYPHLYVNYLGDSNPKINWRLYALLPLS